MAGVNLSEESARILATNSELVGTLTRSCKDDTFLLPAPLQRRILEIGTCQQGPASPCGLAGTVTDAPPGHLPRVLPVWPCVSLVVVTLACALAWPPCSCEGRSPGAQDAAVAERALPRRFALPDPQGRSMASRSYTRTW